MVRYGVEVAARRRRWAMRRRWRRRGRGSVVEATDDKEAMAMAMAMAAARWRQRGGGGGGLGFPRENGRMREREWKLGNQFGGFLDGIFEI